MHQSDCLILLLPTIEGILELSFSSHATNEVILKNEPEILIEKYGYLNSFDLCQPAFRVNSDCIVGQTLKVKANMLCQNHSWGLLCTWLCS